MNPTNGRLFGKLVFDAEPTNISQQPFSPPPPPPHANPRDIATLAASFPTKTRPIVVSFLENQILSEVSEKQVISILKVGVEINEAKDLEKFFQEIIFLLSKVLDVKNPNDVFFLKDFLDYYNFKSHVTNKIKTPTPNGGNSSSTRQTIEYPNGRLYIGQIDDLGEPRGRGVMTYGPQSKKAMFAGMFENGLPSEGELQFKNNDYFSGFFENGIIKDGFVVITDSDQSKTFIGQIENKKPHGQAYITSANGDVCIADFKNGHTHNSAQPYVLSKIEGRG